jgi:hypothetical protein
LALGLRFYVESTGNGRFHRTKALDRRVFGDSPSRSPLVRVAAREAFKLPLCGYQGSVALREKVQGTMPPTC